MYRRSTETPDNDIKGRVVEEEDCNDAVVFIDQKTGEKHYRDQNIIN